MIHFRPYFFLLLFTTLCWWQECSAQAYFGYQTIGRHTFYFSLSYDGKAQLGLGYNWRSFGTAFTDISLENHYQLDDLFNPKESEWRAGFYRPLSLTNRPFVGVGVHARLKRHSLGDDQLTRIGLAPTLLPSYTYAASLTDGPYGTVGLRTTYLLEIAQKRQTSRQEQNWQAFPQHGLELGGHFDFHIERTLGVAINGQYKKEWALSAADTTEKEEKEWQGSGNVYFSTTYNLNRW